MADLTESLKCILSPALLRQMVAARIPFDRHAPLDYSLVGRTIFLEDTFTSTVKDVAFPALKAISKLGLDAVPDLMEFLPEPHSKDFPELCLGLVILLDQAPRALCRGIDERWIGGYFDSLSQRLAEAWHSLPVDVRPDLHYRWCSATETSFDYWLVARFWFGAPFVHSESVQHHDVALSYTGHTRAAVELGTGKADPHTARRDEILSDVYGFARVFRAGPPQGPHVTVDVWVFWMGMLMDIHAPIIRRFGHYPYKNAILGRESSAEEEKWLDKTEHFGATSPEIARKIQEDIAAGRWTPLGEK